MAIETFTLNSSFLTGGSYDDETQELTLDTTGGGVYSWPNIEPEVVEGLRAAESPGKFYHRWLRGR